MVTLTDSPEADFLTSTVFIWPPRGLILMSPLRGEREGQIVHAKD